MRKKRMSKALQESDIDKLAALARLSVVPEERAALAKDIDAILGYVSELESLTLAAPVRSKEGLRNVAREDLAEHESATYTPALLESAPRAEDGYVIVKKVL